MKWYNLLAAPLALLYGAAVLIRNGLYKAHLLHSHSVDIPTICVGNLAVGGTGKTPFVEYLIRLLAPHYHLAVLSRGYKRTTHGFILANDDSTAATIGDESMQLHSKFPDIPIAVCANRVEGVQRLKQIHPDLQVIILDDAFQHRQIHCGFNILLTTYDHLFIDDHFLPLGTLRDAPRESLRAAAIVVTKCPEKMRPIDQRIVDNKLHLPTFQQLYFSQIHYPDLPQHQRVLLVTGIAHPQYLYQHVKQLNPATRLLSFPDHHRFTDNDIQQITTLAQNYDLVLTTEKDQVRFATLTLPESLSRKLQAVAITTTLTNADNLAVQLNRYINENLHPKK